MKSGMIAIVGRSNAGKSTLLNSLVGSKVAITTPKPQTTRRPIQGILTNSQGQAVFVDTPGVMQVARDPLTKKLANYAKEALRGVDAVIYVADPTRSIGDEEKQALRMIENIDKPKLLVINKIDKKRDAHFIDYFRDLADRFDNFVEASAMTNKNTDLIVKWIFEQLPEGEFLYPAYQLTSMGNEEWLAELIREKLFLRLREEVPYTTHVEVTTLEEQADGTVFVDATIFTHNERYKPMIIGAGGRGIKEIGSSTRKELEAVTGKKYYLQLHVEVDSRWVSRLE
ncbi:MAG: GTPase Era [Candidatus Uhrbacteria bacterium GW2011_GWD2_52_7]|uniref:GTPase Era n=1 Tax=Candidatus Uhrbacteria bacterium GW2011_GWD2_52_7 TaxID=1618989 RepID=A0A0G1XEM1_9BACT|nr:MAG: GTPase Era [Candidatus Uhrbacteria bacterium GW2011_GWD2_52_7]